MIRHNTIVDVGEGEGHWKKKFEDLSEEYNKIRADSDLLTNVRGEMEELKGKLEEANNNIDDFENLLNKKDIDISRLNDKIRELELEISIKAKSREASVRDRKKYEEQKQD